MIIVTRPNISEAELDHIVERVESAGLRTHVSRGEVRTIVGCIGDERRLAEVPLLSFPGVESVTPVLKPYKLASREFSVDRSVITVGGPDALPAQFGGAAISVIAGPCSVESRDMLRETAASVRDAGAVVLRGGAFKPRTSPYAFRGLGEEALRILADVRAETAASVRDAGAVVLRGGAFKPRTSPYAFRGLGEEALRILADVRAETGLPVVTEVLDTRQVELVGEYADMFQVGARNMQNFALLDELGKARKPVLLKRGLSATVEELLMAAEYILASGNRDVVLCERGIRTYERATRNTLDVSAIPVLKRETHLPVIVDPSHAGGTADLVAPLAFAAIAAGADGLIVEVHPDPECALSDGDQSLDTAAFARTMARLEAFAAAAGRTVARTTPNASAGAR